MKTIDNKIVCKCGHQIGIVGTKWQHIGSELIDTIDGVKSQIKYREQCYSCKCNTPSFDDNITLVHWIVDIPSKLACDSVNEDDLVSSVKTKVTCPKCLAYKE